MRSAERRKASRDYPVASRDSMMRRAEECARVTGQSLNEAAVVVVEDLEACRCGAEHADGPARAACGVLVAAAGLLLKAESSDGIADIFLGFAVLFAVVGLSFLTRAHLIYADRAPSAFLLPSGTSPLRATALSVSTPAPTAAAGWPGSAWPA